MTHALVELAKAYEHSLAQQASPFPPAPYPGSLPHEVAAKLVEFAHSQYKQVEVSIDTAAKLVSLQLQRDKLDEEIRQLTEA